MTQNANRIIMHSTLCSLRVEHKFLDHKFSSLCLCTTMHLTVFYVYIPSLSVLLGRTTLYQRINSTTQSRHRTSIYQLMKKFSFNCTDEPSGKSVCLLSCRLGFGSSRVKPMTLQLVFIASLLDAQH